MDLYGTNGRANAYPWVNKLKTCETSHRAYVFKYVRVCMRVYTWLKTRDARFNVQK